MRTPMFTSALPKLSKMTMEIILYINSINRLRYFCHSVLYILISLQKIIIVCYICFIQVLKICFNIWIVEIYQNINVFSIKTLQLVRYNIISIHTWYLYFNSSFCYSFCQWYIQVYLAARLLHTFQSQAIISTNEHEMCFLLLRP